MSLRIFCGSVALAALTLAACQDAGPLAPPTTPTVSAAVHQVQLPFRARMAGTTAYSFSASCPAYLARMQGAGVATHLGESMVDFSVCGIPLANGDQVYGPGPTVGVITADNGDEVWFTTQSGTYTAATGVIHTHSTIVGGSGRFTGATGSFEVLGHGAASGQAWTVEPSGWIRY